MDLNTLEKLHASVEWLLEQASFSNAVERLKVKLSSSHEPFVWTTVDLRTFPIPIPSTIKSCWVFVLKRDVPSVSHYHPNSIQHMVAVSGYGRSLIGDVERIIIPFGSVQHSIEEKWNVIGKNVPHEFFPEGDEMVVVSFHTCEASELEEVALESGLMRLYEPDDSSPARDTDTISMRAIGFIRSPYNETRQIPKGCGARHDAEGVLEVLPEFEQGLTDIEGFSHLYVIWQFHKSEGFQLMGTPPLDTVPHGVFATRSPRRPNPLGLTVVRLLSREGRLLHVSGVDMLDGTPILDIKPYLSSVPPEDLRRGWLAEAEARRKQ